MGSISVGTLTLSQQSHINHLLKKEIIFLSEWIISNNNITILIDDRLSTAVIIKISKLVTTNIILVDEISDKIINPHNNIILLNDWSNIDMCNYMLYY